jgi:hypothetical protein
MMAQDILNEIEREDKQEEALNLKAKQRANEFKKMFYPIIALQEETDLNIKECVGK